MMGHFACVVSVFDLMFQKVVPSSNQNALNVEDESRTIVVKFGTSNAANMLCNNCMSCTYMYVNV